MTMVHDSRDDSAVTPLVGILLAFAIFVSLLALVQLTAVPVWNQAEELNHQNEVRNDMQRLSESIQTTASTGTVGSTSVEMGMVYPHRALTRNPPSPTGTLSMGEAGTFAVENAVGVTPETRDYWNGTRRGFTTARLTYEPRYNEIRGLTTVHEGNVMYHRQGDDDTVLASDRKPVNGRTLRLTSLAGNFSTTTVGATDVETFPVSAPTRRVSVTSDGGSPLTFELPTELPESRWDELLEPELEDNGNGGYVANYSVNDGEVTVEMVTERENETVTYSLYMAKVGVEQGFGDTEAEYVTTPEGRGTGYVVESNTTLPLSVEVRDAYNTPYGGAEVSFEVTGDGSLTDTTDTSREDGTAYTTYEAPEDGTATVTAEINEGNEAWETTEFGISVVNTTAGGGGPPFGPPGGGPP